jgi:hypothetical protein
VSVAKLNLKTQITMQISMSHQAMAIHQREKTANIVENLTILQTTVIGLDPQNAGAVADLVMRVPTAIAINARKNQATMNRIQPKKSTLLFNHVLITDL